MRVNNHFLLCKFFLKVTTKNGVKLRLDSVDF